jgi:hypothetical protein
MRLLSIHNGLRYKGMKRGAYIMKYAIEGGALKRI